MSQSSKNKPDSPATRARSDESKALRRAQILEVALEEFFQKGFKAARMDDIAKGVGITKGALYLYFNSKEQLFVGLIECMAKPKLNQMSDLLDDKLSAKTQLINIVGTFSAHLAGRHMPKMMKILIADSGAFPQMVQLYRQSLIEKGLGLLSHILQQGKHNGEFDIDDCDDVARLVIAPMIFSAIWKTVFEPTDDKSLDVQKLLTTHIEILINGISSPLER